MKRSGFRKLSYEQALQDRKGKKPRKYGLGRGKSSLKRGKRLSVKRDAKLAAWSRAVKRRDGNRCQWPGKFRGCVDFYIMPRLFASPCATGDTRIDPHHIAPRSRRRDLKYEVDNGICLCREHHDWVGDHPVEAARLGLNNTESRELAAKKERRAA